MLAQAPKLTNSDIEGFRGDPALRAELRRSLELMLGFYGLALSGDKEPVVEPTAEFEERARNWLTPGNHNHPCPALRR